MTSNPELVSISNLIRRAATELGWNSTNIEFCAQSFESLSKIVDVQGSTIWTRDAGIFVLICTLKNLYHYIMGPSGTIYEQIIPLSKIFTVTTNGEANRWRVRFIGHPQHHHYNVDLEFEDHNFFFTTINPFVQIVKEHLK